MTDTNGYNPLTDDDFPHHIPCIACNRELHLGEPRGPNFWSMCDDGVIFHGVGNFGSSVYDPDNSREYLRVVVCDDCLKRRSGRIQHVFSRPADPKVTFPPDKATVRCFSETLTEEGQLGTTQRALYRLADQAEGS